MGRLKKIYKRVENTSSIKLSSTQEDILYLLLDEMLTIPQIANLRSTSRTAVYNTVEKLKKKGLIKEVEKSSYIKGGYYPEQLAGDNKEYRLHAQNIVIQILDSKPFYRNLLKSKNKDVVDNNSIMFYEDKIIIYSNKDFWGDSVNQCIRLSLNYWERFFTRLENEYKFILIKGKQRRIREFRGEIAKVGDALAKRLDLSKETFRIYIGGELRLICDRSFKMDELEAVHSKHYIEDMTKVEDFYKDLLEKETLKLSEAKDHIAALQKRDLELQKTLEQQNKIIMGMLDINKEHKNKMDYLTDVIGNMAILQKNEMELNALMRRDVEELKRR